LFAMAHQIEKGIRSRCAVGIDVTDQVSGLSQFQAFDESATFADWVYVFERPDFREFSGGGFDHPKRVVAAAVQDHNEFETAAIVAAEIFAVTAQDRSDPLFLVICGNEQQQAGICALRHAGVLTTSPNECKKRSAE